ncbi:saxitoxin and tetrodotoxin-binding protein 1-like isoform X2 [Perca fluviatilis]|uniref:saxitoxin and tetrodotoxin-binding protein 1-like isoform X2 n=1 Tax=Perca fluviatilis TaxID=8168 RepID=UPI0019636D19|nr:saxitoxin and tetrodotoxin-binding protein 1-like isoform X2 [Perca fluviatilis]
MSVVKRAVLLTLLLAAIGSSAAADPEDCNGLNVTLQTKDIHKIFGDWVLVWSVTDHDQGNALIRNVTSSHVELRLHDDNKTVMVTVRNVQIHQVCFTYIINTTMPTDPLDSTMTSFTGEREGHHQDVEKLKADHSDHHKLAACLGFPTNAKPFIYDGAADFCHKKSSPEVEPEAS